MLLFETLLITLLKTLSIALKHSLLASKRYFSYNHYFFS